MIKNSHTEHMLHQLEDAKETNTSHYMQKAHHLHTVVAGAPPEEQQEQGQQVDDVHNVHEEVPFAWAAPCTHHKLKHEPYRTHYLQRVQRFYRKGQYKIFAWVPIMWKIYGF